MVEALQLLPAVDVQDGQAVQLVQGKAGTQKEFGDPLAAALMWQEEGASWLHLVDLDAAFGRGSNAPLLAQIIAGLDINVELSGGIRDDESLERALATGCRRVNIGTAALERPEWCEQIIDQHGDRIAIGLDVRGDRLAARGWTTEGGPWDETLDRLAAAGCARFVVTDVNSDGMLTGPNVELLSAVCARTSAAVVASGGISSLEDLRVLRSLIPDGVEGAIVGTALYLGRFSLTEAIQVAGSQRNGGDA
ncbi:MAG: bifunctional 1-(5-phosphoribosyl)-5-((5-phosphoribosylamino)methylideneamino)imidazole-4-carboxamide isomerase/phosphoribosylanthranilate isomerase PriA [Propionibacteriaceae bacterium]|nr:bifunctional 1-(5-phosphoribosyl)-5-((5-phosphoribosylamino)methylideneamino)imidazole-4-carboxamide isomerase/phosphoribosylanthranilate isomerase PriA [Propionibacteriaceae bacterium]